MIDGELPAYLQYGGQYSPGSYSRNARNVRTILKILRELRKQALLQIVILDACRVLR